LKQLKKEKIEIILKAFEFYDGTYKREPIDAAIGIKKEITPYLVEVLENIIVDPSECIEKENYHSHIYAVMLLGHFNEHKAHEAIIKLFSLPEDIIQELFGELIMEDLPVILLRTSNGNFDFIRSLALNKEADLNFRDAALKAMVFALAERSFQREELISLLDHLFKDNPEDYSWDFADRLAHHVYDNISR